ncbi:hypothetical protein [Streptomyces paradoxus]
MTSLAGARGRILHAGGYAGQAVVTILAVFGVCFPGRSALRQ